MGWDIHECADSKVCEKVSVRACMCIRVCAYFMMGGRSPGLMPGSAWLGGQAEVFWIARMTLPESTAKRTNLISFEVMPLRA